MTGQAQATPVLSGEVYAVRTFRIDPDGRLCPLTRPGSWSPGWNQAICHRGRGHPAPAEGCGCGLYAYSHPDYAAEQPTARTCLAVVATHGEVLAGSRGLRMPSSRIAAVWLSPAVPEHLRGAVAARYTDTAMFSNKAAMLAEFPPSRLPGFRRPLLGPRARRGIYAGLGLVSAGALTAGLLPAALAQAVPWFSLATTVITGMATVITVAAFLARYWGGPTARHGLVCGLLASMWVIFSPSAGYPTSHPIAIDAAVHTMLLLAALSYLCTWRWLGRPGQTLHPRDDRSPCPDTPEYGA
jgi:hypothetical protein